GSHRFVMQATNAFFELEATEFNDYLKEDGLEVVLTFRQKNNLMEKAGKEFYARCTKSLVQAGPNSDETYKKVVGMLLEIVPLNDPYRAKPGDHLEFKVLFEGKPLPYTMVKVWNRKDGTTFMQNIYTKKDGTIDTRLSNTGSWM